MNTIHVIDKAKSQFGSFTRYKSNDKSIRSSFDSKNLHSFRDSSSINHLRKSQKFTGSIDLLKSDNTNLPEILIPSKVDNVLKKTNQRLLRNVDKIQLK